MIELFVSQATSVFNFFTMLVTKPVTILIRRQPSASWTQYKIGLDLILYQVTLVTDKTMIKKSIRLFKIGR